MDEQQPARRGRPRKTVALVAGGARVQSVHPSDSGQRQDSPDGAGKLTLVEIEASFTDSVVVHWGAVGDLADSVEKYNVPVTMIRGPNPPRGWDLYEGKWGNAPIVHSDRVEVVTSDGRIHRLP